MPKIMLVEDDNNLREIYAARMQAEGYEVVTAADGEEALVTGKAEKPDLIISDVMMPKISGFEMLDIIRNTEGMKDVKVIMLTALGQNEEQERADKLGANKYLVKSQVTLEDIVKAAHEMLGDQGDSPAPAGTTEAPGPAEPAETPATTEPTPPAEDPAPAPPAEPTIETSAETTSSEGPADNNEAPAPDQSAIGNVVPGASDNADSATAGEPADTATASPDTDNKVLTDAVDSLLAKTPESAGENENVEPQQASSGMKVIEPIETEPKKDINELLKAETADEPAPTEEPAMSEPAPEAPATAEAPAPEMPATEAPAMPEPTPEAPAPSETPADDQPNPNNPPTNTAL